MRRRDVLALAAGAVAWPGRVMAQQGGRTPAIGFITGASETDAETRARLAAFLDGLGELGWANGRNMRFVQRWGGGSNWPAAIADLVKLSPDVILSHGTAAIHALKAANLPIPIVFVIVNDPVAQGVVPNVGHPGGNITGFSFIDYSMIGKALELLKRIAPQVTRAGFIFNPDDYPYYEVYLKVLNEQRAALGLAIEPLRVSGDADTTAAITSFAKTPGSAIIAPPSTYSLVYRHTIIAQAAVHRLPLVVPTRDSVAEGALLSYGPDQADIFRRAATYIDRILKGANAGDLPVQAPTKFALVVNLKVAKTLGLTVPNDVLAIADETIE